MIRRATILILLTVAFLVLLGFIPALASFAADWFWFSALGYDTVFWTSLLTKLGLGLGVGAVAFAFLYLNLHIAQRGIVPDPIIVKISPRSANIELTRLLRRFAWPLALFFALLIGLAAASDWLVLLRFLNRTPFGEVDPVFGRDIGYYFFTLPAVASALDLLVGFAVIALLLAVPLYVLRRDIVLRGRTLTIEPAAGTHVAVLLALLFVVAGIGAFLVRLPSLLYSTTGPLVGASYTDLAVRAPALRVVGVVALLGAGTVLVGARTGRLVRNAVVAIVLYAAVSVTGAAAAAAIQKFVVAPNELVKETPQLERHIEATRTAWGLDEVATRDLSGEASLTLADIEANAGTVRNIRLWDRAPLLQTFRQLQEIRTYYDFRSVDDDRYWIDGEYRQVLLSPRELSSASLPTRNFINERLTYTHGMGLTLSPVNQVSNEGLPVLFIKDLPPRSDVSLEVSRPEVYFGELTNSHVFVNTRQREFDYPLEGSSAFTVYEGTGGVRVSSLLRKLLLSIEFRSLDVLLTELITRESRVLYHRNIMERAAKALPFLLWDQDPYLVITETGRLVWIIDAYTASTRYPYALPVGDGINYMRNSVKVVIDAYDGDVRAYVADPADPLLETYDKIFSGLFLPLDSLPADLRAHLRYPSDIFRVQTELYTAYHMGDPEVFYAREDQWQIPTVAPGESARDSFLRHMVMKLPGEAQEEYISMTPFTPRQKDNLAAWMVARSDGDHYGQLVLYRFPRQSLVFGPTQIVNRINQDTDISRQISLWDQRGSEVIRGNLLVIPIEESLMFVQALYLRAEGGQIPELKRVIVAYQNQVVMEETLAAGIARLFGGGIASEVPAPTTPVAATATDDEVPMQIARLAEQAAALYDEAIAAQRAGDWARYGEQMRRVGEVLNQMRALAGGGN